MVTDPSIPRRWFLYTVFFVVLIAYLGAEITLLFEDQAKEGIILENRATLSLLSKHFEKEIEKFEMGIRVLAETPSVFPLLTSTSQNELFHANLTLDRYNEALGADVTYLMNSEGLCIASSNRHSRDSFVGNNYFFRPYFQEAQKGIPYRFLTLGITSGRRGLYLSHPVKDISGRALGVVVMKKDLEALESILRQYNYCFVVSPEGVIFLSSRPEMKFTPLWPLSEADKEDLENNNTYGVVVPSSILQSEFIDTAYIRYKEEDFYVSRQPIDVHGWSVILLSSFDKVLIYRYAGFALTLTLSLLALLSFYSVYRIQRDRKRLQQSKVLYKNLAEKSFTAIIILTEDMQCVYVNPEGVAHTGYTDEELSAMDINELIHQDDREMAEKKFFEMISGERTTPYECRMITKDGRIEWVLRNATAIFFRNKPAYLIHCLAITERKTKEERAKLQSLTDQMTGLLNRRGFHVYADQVVKTSRRTKQTFLLLYIDLDGLKQINDTLGHKYGDKAIIEAAQVLKDVFRESDVIARVGGDEFLVIAQSHKDEQPAAVVGRLQNEIERCNGMGMRAYVLSMSIGSIISDPESTDSIEELILEADEIMYREKTTKKEQQER